MERIPTALRVLAAIVTTLLIFAGWPTGRPGSEFSRIPSLEPTPEAALPPAPFLERNVSASVSELPEGLATRGSWIGGDGFTGEWVSGWFTAQSKMRLLVAGYPKLAGNSLLIEWRDAEGRVTQQLFSDPNPRESWRPWDINRPAGAMAFRICALDGATGFAGWLGVSEPVVGNAWSLLGSPASRAWTAFILHAILFVALGAALIQIPVIRSVAPGESHALVAFIGIALLGWIAFWIYFAHPLAGRIFSWTLWCAVPVGLFCGRHRTGAQRQANAWPTVALALLIGTFFFALLLAFEPVRLSHAAANRFVSGLPVDNEIPRIFAERLWAGDSPRQLAGDWLSSDRPPLQTGWVLLAWPVLDRLGIEPDVIGLTGGMFFQLGWVLAAVAFLRHLGLRRKAAWAITAGAAFTGFFTLYSVYVWPKLGAASLILAGYLFWRDRETRFTWALLGLSAGLGWASHGGVAFSLIALLPFLFVRRPRPTWRQGFVAGLTFVAVALPWTGYQKFYEPPGDRLLKWHLAGVIPPDPRSFRETLHDSYTNQSLETTLSTRLINLRLQVAGDWTRLWHFRGRETLATTRADEVSFTLRALAWWAPGMLVWLVLLRRARWRNQSLAIYEPHLTAFGWAATTLAVWIILLFLPHSAIIHQGSLVTQLILFTLMPTGALLLGPWCFRLLAVAQCIWFALVWVTPSDAIENVPSIPAITTAAVAATALLVVMWRGTSHREPALPRHADSEPSSAHDTIGWQESIGRV